MSYVLEKIKTAFRTMKEDAGWDTASDLLYGHFFTDANPENLIPVAEELEGQGYSIVKVYPTDNQTTFFLHVETI